MRMHRKTWFAILLATILLALANLHSWRPGIGARTDRINGLRPEGSELELYYGWPACYQAELLRSDDPRVGECVLRKAPFYLPPYAESWVSSRYVSWPAILLNSSMAFLGLIIVALIIESEQSDFWTRRAVVGVLVIALLLVTGYLTADSVSIHL